MLSAPVASVASPVRRGAIHTIETQESWSIRLPYFVHGLSRYSTPNIFGELPGLFRGAGYEVIRDDDGRIVLDAPANVPKPGKILADFVRDYAPRVREYPRPIQKHEGHIAPLVNMFDYWVDGFDRWLSRSVVRQKAGKAKAIIAGRFATEPWLYEAKKGNPPCYYDGGCFQHCGHGGELKRTNGRMVKLFRDDTPADILDRVSRKGEEGIESEVRRYALGRLLMFPLEGLSDEHGSERAYAFDNLYLREGVSFTLGGVVEAIASAIGWRIDEAVKVYHNHDCWYINTTPIFVHDGSVPDGMVSVSIVDCERPGVKCASCHDRHDEEEMVTVGDDQICESCRNRYYRYCEGCDDWAHEDDVHTVLDWSDGYERERCECCIDNDCDIQPMPDWVRSCASYVDMGR
jgi:hypothetical protein